MSIKTQNKQNRKGMNLYAIIGGIALAAILGLVVAPRLASAELPGQRSNLRSDMNSMEEMLKQYAANHQGSFAGFMDNHALSSGNNAVGTNILEVLQDEGILEGSMSVSSTTTTYFPSWSSDGIANTDASPRGDVGITLTYQSPTRVNVFIAINVDQRNAGNQELDNFESITALERTVIEFARDKYGNVDGTLTAATAVNTGAAGDLGTANPSVVLGAAGTAAAPGTANDGTIEYTIR